MSTNTIYIPIEITVGKSINPTHVLCRQVAVGNVAEAKKIKRSFVILWQKPKFIVRRKLDYLSIYKLN